MSDTLQTDFLRIVGRILNSGQSRSLVLNGNIHDLFHLPDDKSPGKYIPLIDLLSVTWEVPGFILVIYEINGPVRFLRDSDKEKMRNAWSRWRTGLDSNQLAIRKMLATDKMLSELDAVGASFDAQLQRCIGHPTVALELMRQLCLCSRTELNGSKALAENLIILIEGADALIPEGSISALNDADRHRIGICQDWFSDPGFMHSDDCVVLITESLCQLNHRVARLPQVLNVEIPAPGLADRLALIEWFNAGRPVDKRLKFWNSADALARLTAGLSLHALLQLLKGAAHRSGNLTPNDVIAKVESYIQSQLGEDIVEFKKPAHALKDVVGFSKLKRFLAEEFIPRVKAGGDGALAGAAICGPIGGGKTFIFEAVAAELDLVVLVLKNIRSQWFGQTDVIFERLRRVLEALDKAVIFLDEADTQLGGVGAEAHSTERRLTGKVQAMMSDPKLKGRVIWLLMTARIHLLSPDIRRPGRVGDLIIPIMDPEGADRREFLQWAVKGSLSEEIVDWDNLEKETEGFFAASFAALRSEVKAQVARKNGRLTSEELSAIVKDYLVPPIEETRRYQTLQALVNCTRRSLLPDPEVTEPERARWAEELRILEARGIR